MWTVLQRVLEDLVFDDLGKIGRNSLEPVIQGLFIICYDREHERFYH